MNILFVKDIAHNQFSNTNWLQKNISINQIVNVSLVPSPGINQILRMPREAVRRYVLRGVGGHGGGVAPAGFDLESSGCKWRQWMAFDLASGPYLASGRGPH